MRRATAAAFLGALLLSGCTKTDFGGVGVYADRLTLAADDGGNLAGVDRSTSPDVYLRATLREAPVGSRIPLTCQWFDPAGNVAHENVYKTLEVTKPVWDTHCHFLIGTGAPPGTWKVEMALKGRVLLTHPFDVR